MGLRVKILIALTGIPDFVFVSRSIRASSMRPVFALLWLVIVTFLLLDPVLRVVLQVAVRIGHRNRGCPSPDLIFP